MSAEFSERARALKSPSAFRSPASRLILLVGLIGLGDAGSAAAEVNQRWKELWQPIASEVQIARPCSRSDLTHVAAGGRYLALSQPGAHTVALWDVAGDTPVLAVTVGGHGQNAGQLDRPSGVAIDAARKLLFVSDTNNHRVQVFRMQDAPAAGAPAVEFAKAIGRRGGALGEFERPGALALDGAGNLFVIDAGNARVQVFASDLRPLHAFGGSGAGAGELRNPLGIAVAPGGVVVYVVDAVQRRVLAFGADGRFRFALGAGRTASATSGIPGTFFYPADIAVSRDGTVLVTDCGDHVVQRFDARGSVLSPWGRFGVDDGTLNQPRAIAIDERERVFIVDFLSNRAQLFTPTGGFARAFIVGPRGHSSGPGPTPVP